MRDSVRLRVTFSKGGPLTYTSHLDLARVWERALRRARIPLAYSQGFNPRPKLQLAAALPLGHTGEAELLDVWLERPMAADRFARVLGPVLPVGLAIGQVCLVDWQAPVLPTQVVAAEYQVTVEWGEPAESVSDRITRLLAAPELECERRGKKYDLRALVERLWLERCPEPAEGRVAEGEVVLGMQLAARQGATGRPEAVLEVLGMGGPFAHYHRRRLILMTVSD